MKKSLLLSGIFVLSISVNAQNKTYIGVETGLKHDMQDYIDKDGFLYKKPAGGIMADVFVEQEFKKYFSASIGVIFNPNNEHTALNNDLQLWKKGVTQTFFAVQPGIRLNAKIPLIEERLYFNASVGYHLAVITSWTDSSFLSHDVNSTLTRKITFSNEYPHKVYSLIEARAGISYQFKKAGTITLSSSYFAGLQPVKISDITYNVGATDTHTAHAISNGNYFCVSIGYKYPISNFWQKN